MASKIRPCPVEVYKIVESGFSALAGLSTQSLRTDLGMSPAQRFRGGRDMEGCRVQPAGVTDGKLTPAVLLQ